MIIIQLVVHNKFMRYNQLTYHKANPFYKQGFLPDRAWFNRKPKEYPSEIPTGQDYFVDSGRRHFASRFNHSQIQQTGVLKSPEKYPYQNRIALDKDYKRSLDTTDIQGAGSGTRVNEAIRYKLRAQQQLARKHNQSLDLREHKQHQYEQKRRELAMKNLEKIQQRKMRQEEQSLQSSHLSQNPQRNRNEESRYVDNMQNCQAESSNNQKYLSLLPKTYYANLQSAPKQPQYIHKYIEPKQNNLPKQQQSTQKMQYQSDSSTNPRKQQQPPQKNLNANDRYQNNPAYLNNYDNELQRRRQEHMRTIEIDQMTREKLQDKREFRKYNPTNLSFNLAGQSIVSGIH